MCTVLQHINVRIEAAARVSHLQQAAADVLTASWLGVASGVAA